MNEEEVRLLQAAAGFEGNVKEPVSAVVGDAVVGQLSVDDLSVEQLDHALQSLVDTMGEAGTEVINQDLLQHHPHQPPQPLQLPQPEANFPLSSAANIGELNFGADLKAAKAFEGLWGIEDQNAGGVTGPGGMEDGSDIDYEVQLRELQRSLAELSRASTRANTPPPSTQQIPMSSEMVIRPDQNRQVNATAQHAVRFPGGWLFNMQPGISTEAAPPSPEDSNGKARGRRLSIIDPSEDPLKAAERERIRVENRERKKKWRNQNQERNKDNDLRCRVTKRALHLFGAEMSIEKSNWIEREFNRRRSKRVTRTKIRDNDPASGDPNVGSSSVFPAFNQSGSSSYPASSGEMVLRNQLINNPALFEKNAEFVIMELLTLMSTEPTLLPYLIDILSGMKAETRGILTQGGHHQLIHDIDNRITDVSDHIHPENIIGNKIVTSYDRHDAGIGLVGDGSNTGWSTGSQTPVPEGVDGIPGEFESLDRITAGFETLVANLEKSLTDSEIQNNDGATQSPPDKSGQVMPSAVPAPNNSSDNVPSLEEIPLEVGFGHGNISDPNTLDQALENLMREQSHVMAEINKEGNAESQFDEEALDRLIAEGGVDVAELMKAMESEETSEGHQDQAKALGNFSTRIDMNDRGELAQQLKQAENPSVTSEQSQPTCGDDDVVLEAAEMSLEEINRLIAEIKNNSESIPADLDGQSNQQSALPPSSPLPVSSPAATNTKQDLSELYTPENVVAILKTIVDMALHPENEASTPAHNFRGTKRSSPDSCLNPPSNKRPCARAPSNAAAMQAVSKTAINQLNGILISNGYPPTPSSSYQSHIPSAYHPPQTTGNLQSPAYIASFGTTDVMNKKLVAMKPPPYRPAGGAGSGGTGIGGNGGLAGVTAKRKTGDEEKKVRAMGFPPLMAGLKPKSV